MNTSPGGNFKLRLWLVFAQAKIYAIYGERSGIGYFDNIKVEQNGSVSSKTFSNEGTFIDTKTIH